MIWNLKTYLILAAVAVLAFGGTAIYLDHRGYVRGFDEGQAKVQSKFDQFKADTITATAKAQADQAALQEQIDAQSEPSNAKIAETFATVTANLEKLRRDEQARFKASTPLPADCKYDDDRVDVTNRELQK